MAPTAVKPTAGQIARAIALVVFVGPLVGFVLLILGIAIGGLTAPRGRPQDVAVANAVFASWAVIWVAVAAWSAWRARLNVLGGRIRCVLCGGNPAGRRSRPPVDGSHAE